MSAPRNGTPTPHRGIPATTPVRGLPLIERRPSASHDYVGTHRFSEGKTPAQFTVHYLVKTNRVVKGLRP